MVATTNARSQSIKSGEFRAGGARVGSGVGELVGSGSEVGDSVGRIVAGETEVETSPEEMSNWITVDSIAGSLLAWISSAPEASTRNDVRAMPACVISV